MLPWDSNGTGLETGQTTSVNVVNETDLSKKWWFDIETNSYVWDTSNLERGQHTVFVYSARGDYTSLQRFAHYIQVT
jgi:hypothetical protein